MLKYDFYWKIVDKILLNKTVYLSVNDFNLISIDRFVYALNTDFEKHLIVCFVQDYNHENSKLIKLSLSDWTDTINEDIITVYHLNYTLH
jgi:hypothetical protein